MSKTVIWSAHEHSTQQVSSDWFWSFGIITVSIIIASILFHNYILALLVLVAAITLGMLARKEPRLIDISLNENGLQYGDLYFPYEVITRFWIDETHPKHTTLLMETKKIMTPHITISVPQNRVTDIRTLLKDKITESEIHEPLTHQLMEFFGF